MNSKDLKNIFESYQNIQERRANRIDGAAKGQAAKPTGSLRSGNLSFPGDRSGAYDAAKQQLSTPKVDPPKIQTPPQTGGLLGTRNIPTTQELIQRAGGAPQPQFGPGSTNTGQSFPKPPRVARDAGAAVRQRFMARPPVAPVVKPNLLTKVRGGPVSTGLNIATGAALDKYVVEPVGKAGGDALARTILDLTGKGDRARQVAPSLYGKAGPDLTPDIVQGIKSREPKGMSNIPPAEGTVNNPNYGKPVQRPAKELSAAAKDFDKTFAAARKEGKKEFTWRGKQYNTRLKGE